MNANIAIAGIDMVSLDAAKGSVANAMTALGTEWVSLSDSLGRVAAEDVVAEEDLVPHARSGMDGYALRACDTVSVSLQSPVRIPVVGRVFTGDEKAALTAGTAMGITTGAPIP